MRFLFRYNKQINAARSFEESMEKTTLCYLEKDGQYLMLHRVKKENDVNKDKWIGLGGHLEAGETPEMCLLREIRKNVCISFMLTGSPELFWTVTKVNWPGWKSQG